MTPFVCCNFVFRKQSIYCFCFSKILFDILFMFSIKIGHAQGKGFMKLGHHSDWRAKSHEIIYLISRISEFIVVDNVLGVLWKNWEKLFKLMRKNCFRRLHNVNNSLNEIDFIANKINKSLMFHNLANCLFLFIVENDDIGAWSIFLFDIVYLDYFSI